VDQNVWVIAGRAVIEKTAAQEATGMIVYRVATVKIAGQEGIEKIGD
jgi:hypothetical protein